MRYPVGKGTQEDFDRNWYIASFFGEPRVGYYHSGDDYNLKTGGNTDLGEPLYAVKDGVIVSTDTTSIVGFGKQIYEKIEVDGKTYYVGYDHCDSIVVKAGDKVKEGDLLGYLGKSGTKWAHLHFVIKNKPNGMDNVPNTELELTEWENPTEFIKKYIGEETMPENALEVCLTDRQKFWDERDELYRALEVDNQKDALESIELLKSRSEELLNHKCPECPDQPITPEPEPSDELMLVKRIEETAIDGVKITKTYAIDQ